MAKSSDRAAKRGGAVPARRGHAVIAVPVLAIIASALGVIDSSHRARQLFSELQNLQRQALVLNEDWGRLLLEQSTWASHDRIQRLATEKLDMVVPTVDALRVVRVHGTAE